MGGTSRGVDDAGAGGIDYGEVLNKLDKVLSIIRKEINQDMAMSQLHLFVTIALNEGITQKILCEKLDMLDGTVSRNMKWLMKFAEYDATGTARLRGYDLVTASPDPYFRSRNALRLTEKGIDIVSRINEALA